MAKQFILLNMVIGAAAMAARHDPEPGDEPEGEDDGLAPAVQANALAPAPADSNEPTIPTMIQVSQIRNFYPRKPDNYGTPRIGTRVTLVGGGGFAVTNLFDEVKSLVNSD